AELAKVAELAVFHFPRPGLVSASLRHFINSFHACVAAPASLGGVPGPHCMMVPPMSPVPPKKKLTPAQRFVLIFAVFMDKNAPQNERDTADRKLDQWLRNHGKTRADIPKVLAQAAADDDAAQPPPPAPRDNAPHPFEDPRFTPASLVEGIVKKYVTMKPHVS